MALSRCPIRSGAFGCGVGSEPLDGRLVKAFAVSDTRLRTVTVWIDKHKKSLGCFPAGFPGPRGDGVAGFWSQVC